MDHLEYLGGGYTHLGNAVDGARGAADATEVALLQKALVASENITDPKDLVGTGALMPEELSNQIKLLTIDNSHLTLWSDLQALMIPCTNTIVQYPLATGYGTEANWTRQMENGLEDEPTWQRGFAYVKFMRTLYKTGDIAMAVKTIAPLETENRQAAMLRMMRQFEWSMIIGDDALMPEWVPGIQTAVRRLNNPDTMIDQRGNAPTNELFEDATQVLRDNYSTSPSWRMYLTPAGQNTLDKTLRNKGGDTTIERFMPNAPGQAGYTFGSWMRNITTGNGDIELRKNLMMTAVLEARFPPVKGDPSNPLGEALENSTSVRAPDVPVVVVTTTAGPTVGSKWSNTDKRPSAKTYKYRAVAVNRWGKSAASVFAVAAGPVVALGDNTITITPPMGGYPADYFEIYSQFAEGDDDVTVHGPRKAFTVIGNIKSAGAGNPVAFKDLNDIYPRHTSFFILDTTTGGPRATLQIAQLLPVINQPLSKRGPYIENYITMTAAPMYYAPSRIIEIYNVPVNKISFNDRGIV